MHPGTFLMRKIYISNILLGCTLDGLHHVRVLKVAKALVGHYGDAGFGYSARFDAAQNLADFFRLVLVICAHVTAKLV